MIWAGGTKKQAHGGSNVPAALVTGASRGIGAAIARRLARDGRDVIIHYHQDEMGAKATAASVADHGQEAILIQGDLAENETAIAVAAEARDRCDDIDVFVANAGIYDRIGMASMEPIRWRRNLAINLDAPALMSRELEEPLRGHHGIIVHVSSIVASRGTSHGAAYAAAKAALLGLTKAQALELAPDVRVNAVCPGYIDTDMIGDDTAERRAGRTLEVPLRRIGTPKDVSNVVAWLASPESSYVTGQAIHVNGGLWMA